MLPSNCVKDVWAKIRKKNLFKSVENLRHDLNYLFLSIAYMGLAVCSVREWNREKECVCVGVCLCGSVLVNYHRVEFLAFYVIIIGRYKGL